MNKSKIEKRHQTTLVGVQNSQSQHLCAHQLVQCRFCESESNCESKSTHPQFICHGTHRTSECSSTYCAQASSTHPPTHTHRARQHTQVCIIFSRAQAHERANIRTSICRTYMVKYAHVSVLHAIYDSSRAADTYLHPFVASYTLALTLYSITLHHEHQFSFSHFSRFFLACVFFRSCWCRMLYVPMLSAQCSVFSQRLDVVVGI